VGSYVFEVSIVNQFDLQKDVDKKLRLGQPHYSFTALLCAV